MKVRKMKENKMVEWFHLSNLMFFNDLPFVLLVLI